MLKIVIVCTDWEKAQSVKCFFQSKYSIIPTRCFVTEAFVYRTLAKIREDKLTVHAIIDVDGNVTTKELQELLDNEVEYYFVPDIAKLNQAKSFGSCDYPL